MTTSVIQISMKVQCSIVVLIWCEYDFAKDAANTIVGCRLNMNYDFIRIIFLICFHLLLKIFIVGKQLHIQELLMKKMVICYIVRDIKVLIYL